MGDVTPAVFLPGAVNLLSQGAATSPLAARVDFDPAVNADGLMSALLGIPSGLSALQQMPSENAALETSHLDSSISKN